MTVPEKLKVTRVHCNSCGQETAHRVLCEERREWSEEVSPRNEIYGADEYRLISCAGCDAVSLEHVSTFSEDWDPATGEPSATKAYFPPRTYRPLPGWVENEPVPNYVASLLKEIYAAVQNSLPCIAMMGIRALLEAIMIHKVRDQGTFGENLKAFEARGFISAAQRKVLDAALDAGHAAMHRRYVPEDDALITCMDVAEHVVQAVYILPATTKSLKSAVPKRRKHNKKRPKITSSS
jgi:hypothetical protein